MTQTLSALRQPACSLILFGDEIHFASRLLKGIFFLRGLFTMRENVVENTVMPAIKLLCADEYNQLLDRLITNQTAFNEAADALHRILFRDREVPDHYVKNGKTAKGRQRYLDKRTGKTVTLTGKSIVKYTKKTYRQWSEYIHLMLYGLSLAISLKR